MATAPRMGEGTNVTDDTRIEYLRRATVARQDAETYHAIYRNVLKAAKKAGLNTKEMVRAMGDKRRDVDVVTTDIKDHIRFLSLLNMPVTQTSMFEAAAPPVQEQDRGDQSAWFANQAGYLAGKAGRIVDECPHVPGSEEDQAWRRGWNRGQEHLALTSLGGNRKQASDARQRPEPKKAAGRKGNGKLKPDTAEDVREAIKEDDA